MTDRPSGAYAVCRAARWWLLWLPPLLRLTVHPVSPLAVLRDALPALLLSVYAVVEWRACCYRLYAEDNGRFHSVTLKQGVLFCRTLHLRAEDAASVEIERTPLLWLLRARRIRLSTAGLRRRTDAVLCLSANRTCRLFSLPTHKITPLGTRIWPITVLSLSGSNALVGILTAVPLLRGMGRLLGERLSQVFPAWQGVPPLFGLLANVLLLGWGVAVVTAFFRYIGFRAQSDKNVLHIASGVFTRRDILIGKDKVTALEWRQTLFMRLFGLHTAIITAAGYGRDRRARPVLIPAATAPCCRRASKALLDDYPLCDITVRPTSRIRYAAAPLLFLCVGCTLTLWGLAAPLGLSWITAGVWWLLVRLFSFESAGFGFSDCAFTLCYPQRLALCRVYLPREVIDCLIVTRSPFQRRCGTCTVQVRCFGEKRRRYRVFGLPYEPCKNLTNI